jgi:hypothetical protein
MKNLIYVGGSKGGTGKSMMSIALIDYFRTHFSGEEIMVVDTDASNPDVSRVYAGKSGILLNGLSLTETEAGWVKLIDEIDKTSAKHIIINSMAAANLGVARQGELLDKNVANGNLNVRFVVFWLMNRNKDSVTLLGDFLQHMVTPRVYPVLNLYFGKQDEFAFYKTRTDIQKAVGERGGESLVLENLNDLIADRIYTDELAPEDLLSPKHLGLGSRTALERWISEVANILDPIYPSANPLEANPSEELVSSC